MPEATIDENSKLGAWEDEIRFPLQPTSSAPSRDVMGSQNVEEGELCALVTSALYCAHDGGALGLMRLFGL